MARFRYFADMGDETVELTSNIRRQPIENHPKGLDLKTQRILGLGELQGWDPARQAWLKVTRQVSYKSFPSKHECDARCMNARGRTMNCECACGGKNHGKGAGFKAEAA